MHINELNTNFDELFFKVFRNVYLRNEIKNHLKLFEIVKIKSKKELLEYKKRRYIYKLIYGTNETIEEEDIPFGVQELEFDYSFNKEIKPYTLPSTIKSIKFQNNSRYNYIFKEGVLPNQLESLVLPDDYNNSEIESSSGGFNNIFPDSLTSLTLGNSYNPLIVGSIPSSVTSLTLSDNFDQVLKQGDLPSSIKILTFGKFYDLTLSVGSIPSSVISLTFGEWFNNGNKPLCSGAIPFGVKSIKFNYNFNQQILKGSIPASTTSLEFGSWFDKPLDEEGVIPLSVTHLHLGDAFARPLPKNLNKSIKITGGYIS